jgi:hypothetical protein
MPFNGTGFTHNYSGHSTDIVGYAWNIEDWCPPCTFKAVIEAPLNYATFRPDRMEMEIAAYAERNGLDIETTECPQPIFNGEDAMDMDLGRSRRCCRCHEPLIETDEEEQE